MVRGVVACTHEHTPPYAVKPVRHLYDRSIDTQDLGVYEEMAQETIQSVSTLLYASFPSPRRRKTHERMIDRPEESPQDIPGPSFRKMEIDWATRLDLSTPELFVQVPDVQTTALLVRRLVHDHGKPVLFLVPHKHDLDVAAQVLANLRVAVCDSALTIPKRFDRAEAWRSGNIDVLISTRLGSTFEPPKTLGAVVIGRSGMDEHAQYDRNPRYDARRFALSWARVRQATRIITDTAPRCVDADLPSVPSPFSPPKSVTIIHLKDSVRGSDHPLLSDALIDAIRETGRNQERVLLLHNRKMSGERPASEGVEALRLALSKQIEQDIGIITAEVQDRIHAPVLIATQLYYERVYHPLRDSFGLVALLTADQLSYGLSERTSEQALRTLHEYAGIAWRSSCPLLIQAWEHALLQRMLLHPQTFFRELCQSRKDYNQPPYSTRYEVTPKDKSAWFITNPTPTQREELKNLPDSVIIKNLTWL